MPTFTPPTIEAHRTLPGDRTPFGRMARYFDRGGVGKWLLKEGGTWSAVVSPDMVRLAAAQKVLAGGHTHSITDAEATELIAAGFGDGIGELSVDQTTATTENNRWLNTIRAFATWNYLGGDVTDVTILNDGRVVWVGSDWFAGGGVDGDDTFGVSGPGLPFRNGMFVEQPAGTIQARFSTSGTWWVPNQTVHKGRWYWPIACATDGSVMRVGAWLMEDDTAAKWGRWVDNHVLTIELTFGTISTATAHGLNYDRRFRVLDYHLDGATWYILGQEHFPPFESGFGIGSNADLRCSVTRTRLARVATNLTDIAAYQYWTGSTWSSSLNDAALLVDTKGQEIVGDTGLYKVSTGNWMLASHHIVEPWITLYTATSPTGPWRRRTSVASPKAGGAAKNGGIQFSQFPKFVPHLNAPASHIQILMGSHNHLNATTPHDTWHIDTFAPLFTTVPIYTAS